MYEQCLIAPFHNLFSKFIGPRPLCFSIMIASFTGLETERPKRSHRDNQNETTKAKPSKLPKPPKRNHQHKRNDKYDMKRPNRNHERAKDRIIIHLGL